MNILSAENISHSFTDKVLLDDTSFFIQENDKIGIIGINGTGKSTLLKIIAGVEEPQQGTVTKANGTVISFLSQHPIFSEDETVIEHVLKNNTEKNHAWDIETQAKSLLTKFGLTDFNQKLSELSGGQKKRVSLISVLVSPADILVLDEPTNHLDSEMAEYLEEYLKAFKGALVMVTHDRYFLDSVTNRIVEIDKGKLYRYDTNYSGFLELKAEREEMAIASDRKRKSILRTELKWIQRGALARSTKQKARIERYEEMKSQKDFKTDETVKIGSVASRLGKTIIELENVSKSYGEKQLFSDFSYIFLKGDRIGFIGKNGCGKTTLMKIIAGLEQPDSGKVTIGQTVKIGYYTQEIETENTGRISYMDPEKKVIDYIRDTAEYVKTPEGTASASQMLEKFLFPPYLQYTQIKRLSGGEKRRLNLLRVLMEEPNVLILDEPTNDLDIATMTILEEFLDSFEGVVITVSHDRYFLDRIVGRIFAFEKNGVIKQYEGGYTDYSIKHIDEEEIPKVIQKKADYRSSHEQKLKFSYKEQKEYETIEEDIAKLEEKIEFLEGEMVKNSTDFVKLGDLSKEKEEAEKQLEEKMSRWEYLEDLNEKIQQQNKK